MGVSVGLWLAAVCFVSAPAEGSTDSKLRVAVLPFEEQKAVDAARMESCKAVFAYEDVDNNRIGTIPVCLWYPYRNAFLKKNSAKYGTVSGACGSPCGKPKHPPAKAA